MATTLNSRKVVAVANVEKMGEKLIIPDKMTTQQAIDTLLRFQEAQEEMVNVQRIYDAFPWDGAVALNAVLTEKYGWSNAIPTPGFFGPEPPMLVPVEVGYKQTVQVPWGRFGLPGIDGKLQTSVADRRGRTVFSLVASVKRKWEEEIKELFDKIGKYLEAHSIYRGKAVEIDFDSTGEIGIVEPKFINVDVDVKSLVLPEDVKNAVETEVFTPIVRAAEMKAHGIDPRACVVLAGMYGTGKTLTMTIAAKLATENGIFYLKAKRADQLAQAIEFARMYEGEHFAIVSCEDFDRVASGERTVSLDDLLNTVDGVDAKTSKVFCVFTTNAVEAINPAAIRSGRVRAVIEFEPPDAKCVEKLIRYYGRGIVAENAELTAVSEVLAGNIPATIADVVSSSKLAMLKRAPVGTKNLLVDAEALLEAARSKDRQTALMLKEKEVHKLPTIDQAIKELVVGATAGVIQAMAVEGDKLVMKDELIPYATGPGVNGKSTIKLMSK